MTQTTNKDAPRRFVAGAVCTHCKKMDTTVIFSLNQIYHTECIACGTKQSQNDLTKAAALPLKEQLLGRLKRQGQE